MWSKMSLDIFWLRSLIQRKKFVKFWIYILRSAYILQRLMYVAKWNYSTSTWLSFHNVMVKSDYLIYLTNSISYRSFTLQNSTAAQWSEIEKRGSKSFSELNSWLIWDFVLLKNPTLNFEEIAAGRFLNLLLLQLLC